MSETFFENPIYVYIALALAELVLAAIWYERRSKRLIKAMLIPLALAVGAVAHLVVTDREQIIAAVEQMAAAVENKQLAEMAPHIDDDFSSGARMLSLTVTKADVVALANSKIPAYGITSVKVAKIDVEVAGRTAKMHLLTMVHHGGDTRAKTPLIWDIVWIKRQAGWRVLEVTGLKQGIEF